MTEPAADLAPAPRISVRLGIGSAIFQGALVVLGVILGFLVTEWQADAGRRAAANQALHSILEEIAANRDSVAAARAYHEQKIAVLDAAARDNTPPDIRAFDRGFVSPAQVSAAAWTTAGETGALSNLPFDQVLALGRVYGQQSAYLTQQATVSSVIYAEIFERGPAGILQHATGLRGILNTFQYREKRLEEAYGKALSEITAR
jgi:hypothetical protein